MNDWLLVLTKNYCFINFIPQKNFVSTYDKKTLV